MQIMQGAIAAAWQQLAVSELDATLDLDFQPITGGESVAGEGVAGAGAGSESALVNGLVFALLSDAGLALKLPEADQLKLLEMPNTRRLPSAPHTLEGNPFIVLPSRFHNDIASLSIWLKRSIEYVLSLPESQPV